MKFNLDDAINGVPITAYDVGWIRVGEERIESACVVSPTGVSASGLPPSPQDLTVAHLEPLVDDVPEILLLGTGSRQIFADHTLTTWLAERRIALEIMDTGAACRSYNILIAEARVVTAILYMI